MSSRAEQGSRPLGPDLLLERLQHPFPQPERYWVGFSGGLDSTVLLHLLAAVRERLAAPLAAVHVDHGLQADSAAWAGHCRAECRRLSVPLTTHAVDARPAPGESPEAAARAARHAAFAAVVGRGGMLLTAHHLDDQAETLMLQLLRGAGVEGLAAMPAVRPWEGGWLARPLLTVRRREILAWALAGQLRWIEDPSNASTAADRNYLRREILPRLEARWPSAVGSLARSASHCADAAAVIGLLAEQDLGDAGAGGRLRLDTLCGLPPVRAANLLRHWLHRRGAPPLPSARLGEALRQLCQARAGAGVRIGWAGFEIRRYRGEVWLTTGVSPAPPAAPVDWTGEPLVPGAGLGLVRRRLAPGGIDPRWWPPGGSVQLAYRRAGLRCRPAGRRGSRTFKNLLQEHSVPPWLRDRVPLVFIDGRPAAVANCCTCDPFAAPVGEDGWLIEWLPDDPG